MGTPSLDKLEDQLLDDIGKLQRKQLQIDAQLEQLVSSSATPLKPSAAKDSHKHDAREELQREAHSIEQKIVAKRKELAALRVRRLEHRGSKADGRDRDRDREREKEKEKEKEKDKDKDKDEGSKRDKDKEKDGATSAGSSRRSSAKRKDAIMSPTAVSAAKARAALLDPPLLDTDAPASSPTLPSSSAETAAPSRDREQTPLRKATSGHKLVRSPVKEPPPTTPKEAGVVAASPVVRNLKASLERNSAARGDDKPGVAKELLAAPPVADKLPTVLVTTAPSQPIAMPSTSSGPVISGSVGTSLGSTADDDELDGGARLRLLRRDAKRDPGPSDSAAPEYTQHHAAAVRLVARALAHEERRLERLRTGAGSSATSPPADGPPELVMAASPPVPREEASRRARGRVEQASLELGMHQLSLVGGHKLYQPSRPALSPAPPSSAALSAGRGPADTRALLSAAAAALEAADDDDESSVAAARSTGSLTSTYSSATSSAGSTMRGYEEQLSDEEQTPPSPRRSLDRASPKPLREADPELARLVAGLEVQYSELKFGSQIGTGYYGEVYEAMLSGKRVAVKVLNSSLTPSLRKAFLRELQALRQMQDSPHVVRLLGASVKPYCCVIMELADGGSLHDLLYVRPRPLSLAQALQIGRDVAEALRHLHARRPAPLLHRDVTSKNVLVRLEPDPDAAHTHATRFRGLLSDFGIARPREDRNGRSMSPLGPKRYRAPEVTQKDASGCVRYSRKVDVYMFATVLFELVYRREPFAPHVPDHEVAARRAAGELPALGTAAGDGPGSHVPSQLRKLIAACWHVNPKHRPHFAVICPELAQVARRLRQQQQLPPPATSAPIPAAGPVAAAPAPPATQPLPAGKTL